MNQEDAVPQIDWGRADLLIELALNEDLDTTGDVTTASVVPEEATATAVLRCKEPKMVLAGIRSPNVCSKWSSRACSSGP